MGRSHSLKGLFITLEGPDGSGKTTILNRIKAEFKNRNIDIVTSREPGGTRIGEEIREIILDKENTLLADETEALLYAASRAQHVAEVIEPAIKNGQIVISDRFLLSSLAYQGVGRGLGIEKVKLINDFGLRNIQPDLILFFYIDPEETLRRKTENNGGDRLELEGDNFHRKVYNGYRQLIEKYPENIVIIDARESVEEVAKNAMAAIDKLIYKGGN